MGQRQCQFHQVLQLVCEQICALLVYHGFFEAVCLAGRRIGDDFGVAAATNSGVVGLGEHIVVVGVLVDLETALADANFLIEAGPAKIILIGWELHLLVFLRQSGSWQSGRS